MNKELCWCSHPESSHPRVVIEYGMHFGDNTILDTEPVYGNPCLNCPCREFALNEQSEKEQASEEKPRWNTERSVRDIIRDEPKAKPQEEPKDWCCGKCKNYILVTPGDDCMDKSCPCHHKESESTEVKLCACDESGMCKMHYEMMSGSYIILERPKGTSIVEAIFQFCEWFERKGYDGIPTDNSFLKLWQEWLKSLEK